MKNTMSMSKLLKFLFTGLFLFTAVATQAQDSEMATLMRSNGKIYVVVTVLLIIFLGLAIYLFALDRKISRLEKARKEEQK